MTEVVEEEDDERENRTHFHEILTKIISVIHFFKKVVQRVILLRQLHSKLFPTNQHFTRSGENKHNTGVNLTLDYCSFITFTQR